MGKTIREKIILGLDPGTNIMGYGLIVIQKPKVSLIQYGVIHLSKYEGHELKLRKIFERVTSLLDEYHPDEVALEAPFFGKNVQSMLKLGRGKMSLDDFRNTIEAKDCTRANFAVPAHGLFLVRVVYPDGYFN